MSEKFEPVFCIAKSKHDGRTWTWNAGRFNSKDEAIQYLQSILADFNDWTLEFIPAKFDEETGTWK